MLRIKLYLQLLYLLYEGVSLLNVLLTLHVDVHTFSFQQFMSIEAYILCLSAKMYIQI